MNRLISYIESIVKLDEAAVAAMHRLCDVEVYSKNEHVLELGHRCNKIWFLNKGMVRKYHIEDGKEVTCWIHTENEIITSLRSYSEQSPSTEYIQACEETELIGISKQNVQELVRYPQFQMFTNVMMEKAFVNIDVHTKEFNSRDAKGKYNYLQQIAPEIVKRAKLGYVASILGISQETLSRIRKG